MNKTKISRPKVSRSEQGMVAIMTTMILIIVVSLIVLGFAQISRRNQREALDRQLSTQAFYAAETGINDARNLIKQQLAAGATIVDKDTCTGSGTGNFYATLNSTIDGDKNVSYSCLLVDASPSSLRYSNVDSQAVVVPVISANGNNISRINLTWQPLVSANPLNGCPSSAGNVFTPTASWSCGYGVLRFDLVPTAGNGLTSAGLQSNTMTTFAVPISGGSSNSVNYQPGTANANVKTTVSCTSTQCSLSIANLSQSSYHMRISSLYRGSALEVTAYNASNTKLDLTGAQALIDATGRAQDVLRRVQVYVPVRPNDSIADYAIQTTDSICKRFVAMDGYFDNDSSLPGGTSRLCSPTP